MENKEMHVNISRIMERIGKISEFNDTPGEGVTRFSYGENDRKVREYFSGICNELGLTIHVDSFGNIRAHLEGTNPELKPLLVGSHLDSVRNGGKYDGILGVVGALEVVNVLNENGVRPERSIDVIVFAEEEGSNFGSTMVGSKGLVGKYQPEGLKKLVTPDGKSCYDCLVDFGLDPEKWQDALLREGDVHAMLELHIEQSIVLERVGIPLGVVQVIAGMETLLVKVEGTSNHAGATPMNLREDPMVAAAKLIYNIRDFAKTKAGKDTVATVGKISASPNMPNVIAKQVTFSVDIRDVAQEGIDTVINLIRQEAEKTSQEENVKITIESVGKSDPISLSPEITEIIRKAADSLNCVYHNMNSGAVHDSGLLAKVTDVGMIFIPSKDGISHDKNEFSSVSDIETGCNVLLQAALILCGK